jgi:hypothetical protein
MGRPRSWSNGCQETSSGRREAVWKEERSNQDGRHSEKKGELMKAIRNVAREK